MRKMAGPVLARSSKPQSNNFHDLKNLFGCALQSTTNSISQMSKPLFN